jgi:hypothetical protein
MFIPFTLPRLLFAAPFSRSNVKEIYISGQENMTCTSSTCFHVHLMKCIFFSNIALRQNQQVLTSKPRQTAGKYRSEACENGHFHAVKPCRRPQGLILGN